MCQLTDPQEGTKSKRINTIAKVKQLAAQRTVDLEVRAATNTTFRSEVWLQSNDGLLGGFVDRIVQKSNGVEIVDYKSGFVTERNSNKIKEQYRIQLLLYAGLYFESYGVWPVRLTLTNLIGSEYDVPMDSEESHALMEEARDKINEINTSISDGAATEDFANPSPAACMFCGYRPACRQYWKSRKQTPDWPYDVSGKVESLSILGNGSLIVQLMSNQQELVVRGLSPDRFAFLFQNASAIMLCDLMPDVIPGSYKQSDLSVGFAFAL